MGSCEFGDLFFKLFPIGQQGQGVDDLATHHLRHRDIEVQVSKINGKTMQSHMV